MGNPPKTTFKEHRINTPRINDEEWEKWKPHILQLFDTSTLKDTMEQMEKKHKFVATKRQYVHRIGKTWDHKKYNTELTSGHSRTAGTKTIRKPNQSLSPNRTTTTTTRPSRKQDLCGSSTVPLSSSNQQLLTHTLEPSPQSFLPHTTDKCGIDFHAKPPEMYAPRLAASDIVSRYRRQADMLSACGDYQLAFHVYAALYHIQPTVEIAVHCAMTFQTDKQALEMRNIMQNYVKQLPTDELDDVFYVNGARMYDRGFDEGNAIGQMEDWLNKNIEGICNGDQLTLLRYRSSAMDIPLYQSLDYAMRRFNSYAQFDAENEPLGIINEESIRRQYINQQPAFAKSLGQTANDSSATNIRCLFACLEWCIAALDSGPTIPEALNVGDGGITRTYQVICTLWLVWQTSNSSSATIGIGNLAESACQWDLLAEVQLGMSPSDLLGTVIRTFMASRSESVFFLPQKQSVISDALLRARFLSEVSKDEIFSRFLSQVRKAGRLRTVHPNDTFDDDEEPVIFDDDADTPRGFRPGFRIELDEVAEIRSAVRDFVAYHLQVQAASITIEGEVGHPLLEHVQRPPSATVVGQPAPAEAAGSTSFLINITYEQA